MTEPAASTTARPAPADLPFRLLGLVWVLTGGLTAAVTGPLGREHGSWSAAFQVLVGGVLQGVRGIAQHGLAARAPGRGGLPAELLRWDLGGPAVIGGRVLGAPLRVAAA